MWNCYRYEGYIGIFVLLGFSFMGDIGNNGVFSFREAFDVWEIIDGVRVYGERVYGVGAFVII